MSDAPGGESIVVDGRAAIEALRRKDASWYALLCELPIEFRYDIVLVVDNHRVLHGRRPFETAGGQRHLQGCYIDHDGPATMWRLLTRRQHEIGARR